MGNTTIEWCDKVWNPIRGCSRVSSGCEHCYAEKQAHRFSGKDGPYEGLTRMTKHGPVWTGKIKLVPHSLDQPIHWRKPSWIFVNSMSDLFHEAVPDEFIDKVFAVMALTSRHIFQILTKRPERMHEYITSRAKSIRCWEAAARSMGYTLQFKSLNGETLSMTPWPLPNVWLCISAEDQQTADERIPILLKTSAAVRGVSLEPLLGPIDLRISAFNGADSFSSMEGISWVVCGGESGDRARLMNMEWPRSIITQCREAGVPCFIKQDSGKSSGEQGRFTNTEWSIKEFPNAVQGPDSGSRKGE